MRRIVLACAALAAGPLAATARADVLVDAAPSAPLHFTAMNQAELQNVVVQFTLRRDALLTAFDLFTEPRFGDVGQPVVVKLKADAAGIPAPQNLLRFTDAVDTSFLYRADTRLSHVAFGPVPLQAGTYWIGVSGLSEELGWSSFRQGPEWPPGQYLLDADTPTFAPGVYRFAWRLHGQMLPVDELHPLWLGGLGLALGRLLLRRRAHPMPIP